MEGRGSTPGLALPTSSHDPSATLLKHPNETDPMAQTTRTFIAVPMPDAIGERLGKLQNRLGPKLPSIRWNEVKPFHLTLAFLGDVPFVDLNPICEAVARASRTVRRFELEVAGLGVFPSPAKPRVLWAGLTGPGLESLAQLHKAVVDAVTETGHRPDDARFSPHVTLGRIKPGGGKSLGAELPSILEAHREFSAGIFTVGEAVAYSSTLTPEGPAYAALARGPLASAKNRTGP